eukprot:COSAG02_NODE_23468_length_717_cov_4.702265_1_plen_45_part_10
MTLYQVLQLARPNSLLASHAACEWFRGAVGGWVGAQPIAPLGVGW